MVWHDCKTDPPLVHGIYLLVYKLKTNNDICWTSAFYSKFSNEWIDDRDWGDTYKPPLYEPIKWAEVDLSEATNGSVQM